jgi:uncharacterized protein
LASLGRAARTQGEGPDAAGAIPRGQALTDELGSHVPLIVLWLRSQSAGPPWPQTGGVNWAGVGAFVAVVFGLGWAAWVGLQGILPLALRTYIAEFAPMFGVIGVLRVQRRGRLRMQRRVGLRRLAISLREALLGIGLVVVAVGAGLGLGLMSGAQVFRAGAGTGLLTSGLPLPVGLLIYLATAFGEEYGWRGFLVPQLAQLGGLRQSVLVAGLFAAWHFPPIFLYGFDYPAHHVEALGAFLAFAIPFTVVQTWLRAATRGLGAPVAAHAAFNLLTAIIYANVATLRWGLSAPVGLLGALPFAVIALAIVLTGRMWPARVAS